MTVIPRPQEHLEHRGELNLSDLSGIVSDGTKASEAGCEGLIELLAIEADYSVSQGNSTDGDPVIALRTVQSIKGASGSEEAYRLSVTDTGIQIDAPSAAGFMYAGQTLVGLLTGGEDAKIVQACEVRDWPVHEWRGVMVDPAREFIPIDRLYTLVDRLARAKLNYLHLHLLDSEGYALESKAYPALGTNPDGTEAPTYSHSEMAELIAYGAERNVTIIPEIDMPGHGHHLLAHLPDVRCEGYDEISDYGPKPAICVASERTYDVVETLIDEVLDLFETDIVHVGADEWSHHGVSWEECERCQATMDAEGYSDVRELSYHFIRRIHRHTKERGGRLTVWNDQFDISEQPDIPEDLLIQFWVVSYPPWGPDPDGNSMEAFVEAGHEVINSYVRPCYLNTTDSDRLIDWTPTRFPSVSEANAEGVRGAELAIWGDGYRGDPDRDLEAFHRRMIPSTVPVFADRLWNATPVEEQALRQPVTRHVIGPSTPDGFDVFSDLGGVIPPSIDNNEYAEKANVTASIAGRSMEEAIESYEAQLDTLREMEPEARFPEDIAAYIDAYEWLIESVSREARGFSNRPDKVGDTDGSE